jgi:hypothetical protein
MNQDNHNNYGGEGGRDGNPPRSFFQNVSSTLNPDKNRYSRLQHTKYIGMGQISEESIENNQQKSDELSIEIQHKSEIIIE